MTKDGWSIQNALIAILLKQNLVHTECIDCNTVSVLLKVDGADRQGWLVCRTTN